ncbi:hypothetical protein AAFF_G00014360 [Aldrovandia affinis]|uniref:Uncharacterized protein n=1 Tax=Aldrovandia affinis TaxID=143900 RepID=A0AAD7WH64_9TELE|nr:hypothetical protein AAFF_G00014360 [Aldrovandia affinis]
MLPHSRGRAVADDDHSTDGIEMAESESAVESAERKDTHREEEEEERGDMMREDDPPLSPLFQHLLSEDCSEQLCAFCYCGKKSLLGQGELKMFGPTPGYVPLHIRNRRGSSENDTDVDRSPEQEVDVGRSPKQEVDVGRSLERDPARQGGLGKACSPDSGPVSPPTNMTDVFVEEPARKLWDELGQIGLPDHINVQSLFDPTGQCCAHLCCAAWSEGVCRGEGQSLLYVDKAIDSGSTKHCACCKRLGASLPCSVERCSHSYHYPCAAAAGAFQNIRSRSLLCPDHTQLVVRTYEDEANCTLCDSPGDLLDLLFCTSCGQHYHGLCLDITVTPLKRAGWQCPECKVCQTCKNPGEDSKMLVCDMCDKGYHTFCLQPVMDTIPTNGWRCKNCRVCVQCGIRSSGQWHHTCLLCDGCYQQQEATAPCPLCGKALHPELHKEPLSCHTCKRCLYLDCELGAGGDVGALLRDDYICTACKQVELVMAQTRIDPAQEGSKPCPESASELRRVVVGDVVQQDRGANEASAGEAQRDALSVLEAAQEIQVTVTVTEGPASPQLVGAPAGILGEHPEVVDGGGASKKAAGVPPDEAGYKPMPAVPIELFSSPTKEPVANLEELMELSLSAPPSMEMNTTPESEPSFSDLGSPTGKDRELKQTPETTSTSSAEPAWSPLSAGSSPKEAAPTPPVATTLIPVMLKMGMGKPAISKRKFSPGRPRVKQGAWSDRSAVSSPSRSPDSDGWEVPKTRQPLNAPFWTAKVGRGSGFAGRRRPRGANLSGRGGRGRSKLKSEICPAPPVSMGETFTVKEEEENAMHNTIVMFSTTDSFTLRQDMCVVCGSFGQGVEGRLLACSQCGQCYHPFCVNIKITKVVLSKGWRCLECTVCEACGKATDPGRLLLCDDCDISYHTYCLDPPLHTVPKGSWKCKWCVSCNNCGATSPGPCCEWQNNYTQCAPCASLAMCPVCLRNYREDQLIVQCQQCYRWIHASCEKLNTDEEVEKAADSSFDCTMCLTHMCPAQGMAAATAVVTDSNDPPIMAQIVTKVKEQDQQRTYTQDGVCLTEVGLSRLQSLAAQRKRPKPKLKLKIINQNSVAVLQPEQSQHANLEESPATDRDLVDCEGRSESSPEPQPADEDSSDRAKKRKRKPYRPGIGGFMVRQRNRTEQGKANRSLSRKPSSGSVCETILGKEEGGWSEMVPHAMEDAPTGLGTLDKVKKRYRKKKTQLEEAFPSYLQEAFFGKELLGRSKQVRHTLEMGLSDDDHKPPSTATSFLDPSSDPLLSSATTPISTRAGPLAHSEDPLVDLSEVLNTDEDILGLLSDDLVKPGDDSGLGFCPFREISPSPFGAILSKLYKIPELEGKDVEDLFTAVLSPSTTQAPQLSQPLPTTAQGPPMPLPNPGDGMFPRMPVVNGLMGQSPHFPPTPLVPGRVGRCVPNNFSPIQRTPFPDNMREENFNQMESEVGCPWTALAPAPLLTPLPEGETDTMSNAQRSTLKWEKEETLGEMATVAPVLYTNVNFPNLREDFPDWTTRVKQIAKLWRKASSQERAPYVQKARDNRAALRINKVQMSNESMKRQQPPDPFDPSIPLDSELLFKNQLKPKESEHEREWKFRQGELIQMWGPSKKQREKVPKTKAIKSSNKEVLFGHSSQATIAAGWGKNSLQMRQKSKQQAKIEATQKLEQVKNEQQQLQLQFGKQSGAAPPSSGSQSPAMPQQSNEKAPPLQPMTPKEGFPRPQLPGTPTSVPSEDVFARPQPPPPNAARNLAPNACFQGQLTHAPYPQMFSPGSSASRPSSPWDPYAEMVGTPRPPPAGSSMPRKSPTGSTSPAHEPFGSPTSVSSDPYAKPPDTPRPTMPTDPFVKYMRPPRVGATPEPQGRSTAGDSFAHPALRAEVYQRMSHSRMILSDPYSRPLLTPIPGSNESGSMPLFKAPMPPPQSQDLFKSMPSAPRRSPVDPYEKPDFSQNKQGAPYTHPPLTSLPVHK